MAHIEGIYELGHVLFILDAASHGFAQADIARVESYWIFGDMHGSSAGFVLALGDGRRAYVDFLHWHAFEQDEDFRIAVDFLADGERCPAPPPASPRDRETWPLGGWSSETAHLNRVLAG